MWKNPEPVIAWCRYVIKNQIVSERFERHKFPVIDHKAVDVAYATAKNIFDEMAAARNKDIEQNRDTQESVNMICSLFSRHVVNLASNIEETKNWSFLSDLWSLSARIQRNLLEGQEITEPAFDLCVMLAESVHLLVGTDSSVLVGTRHGNVAFQKLKYPVFKMSDLPRALKMAFTLEYFGPEDLDILPEVGCWLSQHDVSSSDTDDRFPAIIDPWLKIADLLESSYYNQQFMPHPSGSVVKILGVPGVEQVVLKAKKSVADRNYIDLVGIFTIDNRQFPCVLDGDIATRRVAGDMVTWSDLQSRTMHFMRWLLAQLYHDLVTAKDVVPGRERRLGNKAKAAAKLPEKVAEDLKWIYIPRKRKKETLEIRRPAVNPRSMSPHRVSGHKRRANMTDRQREAVRALEQESGIEILRWIPEGYTFVRPHIVPADGSASIMQLPRFIRTRIQEDIKSLLLGSDE